MSKTEKLKSFLDSNVVISFLQGTEESQGLFSERVLAKVQYVISPIVYQEILLVTRLMEKRDLLRTGTTLAFIDSFVKVITIATSKTRTDSEILRQLRDRMVHTNDIVLLQAAIENCEYFLTLDRELLQIKELATLKIVSPTEFLKVVEESR